MICFGLGMIEDGSSRRAPPSNSLSLMNDFGFGGGLFGGLMRHMEDFQNAAMNDPNSHVFTQSTMISYDGTNGGQPRIIEKSVRKTGDVKETRSSVRQGEDGIGDRMAIEHTIGNRTHVIEKKRDRDGRIREQQHFVNLDQNEAEDFDREFASRVRRNMGATSGERYRAIEHGPSSRSGQSAEVKTYVCFYCASVATTFFKNCLFLQADNASGGSAPIVTLVDDDAEEEDTSYRRHASSIRPSSAHRSRHRHEGPIIREIDDGEEEQRRDAKRRKGVFGRFFKANDE
uniref:Myeloid leukemia factor n=1 Tax=Syphacia muris TaxID=451379 RepID=A0A0N5AE85_9BILA